MQCKGVPHDAAEALQIRGFAPENPVVGRRMAVLNQIKNAATQDHDSGKKHAGT